MGRNRFRELDLPPTLPLGPVQASRCSGWRMESDDEASTADSSGRFSRVSDIWCVLQPLAACHLLSFLGPSETADFAACCFDHHEHIQIALIFLALQVLASFLQLARLPIHGV